MAVCLTSALGPIGDMPGRWLTPFTFGVEKRHSAPYLETGWYLAQRERTRNGDRKEHDLRLV